MGKGKGRKSEEERENARPSSSLLERALVIRTETVSSTKEGTFDRKFTGLPMIVPWSKQLRLIFRREILSFPFLSLAPRRAFKYNAMRSFDFSFSSRKTRVREMETRLLD